MIHPKRLVIGMLLVAGLAVMAVIVSGALVGLTRLGVWVFFGRQVDLPRTEIVNPAFWVLFGLLMSYVAGCAWGDFGEG